MPSARIARQCCALLLGAAMLSSVPALAQPGARTSTSWRPTRRWLTASALLVAAAVFDARVRDFAARRQSPGRDRIADAIDPAGRAGVLIPALAISVGLPRLLGQRALSDRALRVTADYFAADAVESVLKPLIGRHRPSDAGGPWRFRPVQHDADWHSLPSAHTVHAFAIASGIAHESESPVIGDAAYLLAGLVGVQRVYTGAHWSSDIVASALLATTVSAATDRMVRAHLGRSDPRGRMSDTTQSRVASPCREFPVRNSP